MDHFHYKNDKLYAEDVAIHEIAERFGTPCYIYSKATLEHHWQVFDNAFGQHPHRVCFAVKANSNIAVLNVLARLGSGFDIVSQGELERVLVAGGDPQKIVFSGVGKQIPEIQRALDVGIFCFNVESKSELLRLNDIAAHLGKKAAVSLRVNPDINPRTHPYIATGLKENKFGVGIDEALSIYEEAAKLGYLRICGIGYHIGSQLLELEPFLEAFEKVYQLVKLLGQNGIKIEHIDLGGGLGVCYSRENPPTPLEYISTLLARFKPDVELIIEPGRAIAANAGLLITRIEYIKHTPHKNFVIVDAAMNDLLRPVLYEAYQEILPVHRNAMSQSHLFDVVGPICETGDFLGKDRILAVKEQDLLAIRTAGAYGFVMSSNYNSRPRVSEIMVSGNQSYEIRKREKISDLFANEQLLPQ